MSIIAHTKHNDVSRAKRKAARLKQEAKQLTEQLVRQWQNLFATLWQDENPQEILDELGTDAAEFFVINGALVSFMVTTLTGKRDDLVTEITALVGTLPDYTINQNGSVTIQRNK